MTAKMTDKPDVVTLAGMVEWRSTMTLDEMAMWIADAVNLTDEQREQLPDALAEMFAKG